MRVSGEEDGMRRTFADRIYNFLIGAVVTFICIICQGLPLRQFRLRELLQVSEDGRDRQEALQDKGGTQA